MFRSLARAVAVAGATALALTACGGSTSPAPSAAPAGTVSVTDATGQVVDVPTSPTRVVVFDMSLLDSLDTLGVPVAGLPKQNVPEFLAEYRDARYADVGTLFEANLEAVNAADPDLILVAGRSAELKDDLTPIAPTLDLTTDSSRLMADYERNARTLGTVFGKEAEVEKRLGELNTSITETKGLAADAGRGLIVLTSGTEATAYGPGSRFGIIHDVLGVPPAIPDVEAATHGEAISFELIAQTNPDRMFVVDRDAATGNPANAQQVLNNELVTGTAAWRNGDVTYLDPTRWYIANAGLSTLPASVEEIRASLQAA
ncbi:MAG TPA: ABC transporter substrate-binding protein [Pseudonocardia sp.]|jgi:iron complex transport system substrate-binding protein|nr:ABC transporter substrate-binding protein [Pseudonocardia sp.]